MKDHTQPFARSQLADMQPRLVNKGRWGNATLTLVQHERQPWIVKDFRGCPPVVRHVWGLFMVRRELLALDRLDGIPGLPQNAFRMDAYALAYRFMPGTTLRDTPADGTPPEYFRALEAMVKRMHERGVVHLDIRYRRNVLVLDDGSPGLVDFQSHLRIDRLPRFLQRWLRGADLSGVYKHWCRRHPATLGPEQQKVLRAADRRRRFWRIKGYGFHWKRRRKRRYEKYLEEMR